MVALESKPMDIGVPMIARLAAFSSLLFLCIPEAGLGQEAAPGDNKPLLRLEGGGPTSNVTSLAFSPSGDTLYAAGFDKVVRVWERNLKSGLFELDEKRFFRVPINPGTEGAINAMALSPDGEWLAVGGRGVTKVAAGYFKSVGRVWPVLGLTPELREDQGLIYVFSTRRQEVRVLRGHTGEVLSLAFAPAAKGQVPLLVSAANGWDSRTNKVAGEVRVWDVAKEVSLGAWLNFPPPEEGGLPPGLAAIPTGSGRNQLRVVVAWGDQHKGPDGGRSGYLRLLDLDGPQGQIKTLEDGYRNTALALLSDEKTLLSGSFLQNQGRLQMWDLAAKVPEVKKQLSLAAPTSTFNYPEGLALFTTKDKGSLDHVAVVVRQLINGTAGEANRLHLMDLNGITKVEVPLWKNMPISPVLAARGGHVAVAGNKDHSIHVYAIADLLRNKIQPQVLHSVGATVRQVAFATRKEKDKTYLGLMMNEAPSPGQKGGLIFDFKKRALTDQIQGWVLGKPDLGDWRSERSQNGQREVFKISKGAQLAGQITLPAGQRADAVALLPPQPFLNEPLLVVASYVIEKGLPALEVYRVRTGKLLRWYTGHTAPISALALSPDGKLLASASSDQTVAVWSLTDLDEILDRQGRLTGLAVEKRGQDLVVARVDDDGPANLAVGTVIEAALVNGKEVRPPTALDFYETFWKEKPGTDVTLRLLAGKQKKVLALKVDQGIDERKALFSLFVTQPGPGGARDWLGWNNLGPYDASRPGAESYLGWHFNTDDKKEPTRFALIQEYRAKYYQKDILARLVETRSLAEALKPPPPPPPPEINDAVNTTLAPNGDIFVREPKVTLQIPIRNVLPKDQVHWQLDGGAALALSPEQSEGDFWSLPLNLTRGRHTVRVWVARPDQVGGAKEVSKEMAIRYQPAAPRLEMATPGINEKSARFVEVKKADFPFKALLHSPGAGPDITVSLWLNDQDKPRKTWNLKRSKDPQEISDLLGLKEGTNLIKVVAQNDGALADFKDEEIHTLTLQVAVNSPAPSIAVQRIESLDGGDGTWPFQPGQKVVVDIPRVRIVGVIKSQAELAPVEWDLGEKFPRQILTFKAGQQEFAHDMTLKPGENTVRFFAKSVGGKEEGTGTVALFYRPQLPLLVFQEPKGPTLTVVAQDQWVLREPDGSEEKALLVEARIRPPSMPSPVPFPLKATIWRNGAKILGPIFLQSSAEVLPPQQVLLKPGMNRILVRLEPDHDGGGISSERALEIRYLRPPRIAKVEALPVKDLPFVDLRALVHSPVKLSDLPMDSIQVYANGQRQKFAAATFKPAPSDPADRSWILEVKEVPLVLKANQKIHENQIKLVVGNADGLSDGSQVLNVIYKVPPPPPPLLSLVAPASENGTVLEEPEFELKFQVKSAQKLKRVEVTDVTKGAQEVRVANWISSDGDLHVYATGKLPLEWGMNKLKVEAVNDGGSIEKFLTLSVPDMPVKLAIDSIRTVKGDSTVKMMEENGQFPEVPSGEVVVEGRVRLGQKVKEDHSVRIYVNGFQQLPVKLGRPSPKTPWERPFTAKLILNLPENNIELDLPTLPKGPDIDKSFQVACKAPVRGQFLHIVLLAPEIDRKKGLELKKSIARALDLQDFGSSSSGLYKSKVFELVRMEILPYVSLPKVETVLYKVHGLLHARAHEGHPNDVVMFYFLGKETVNTEDDRFLWTDETEMGPQGPVNVLALNDMVKKHFQQLPGAQVMFLDLGSNKTLAKGPGEELNYRLAMFRHVQLKVPSQKLLQELAREMPQTTWLDQLRDNLRPRFLDDNFYESVPKNLKMKINQE